MSYIMSEKTYKIIENSILNKLPIDEKAFNLLVHLGEHTPNTLQKARLQYNGETIYIDPNSESDCILKTEKSDSATPAIVFGTMPVIMTTEPLKLEEIE